jgi:ferredoxin
MCDFCHQHGEGRKWYLNAKNYAEDLLSDARRRRFLEQFNNAPQEKLFSVFEGFDSRMDRLNQMPGIVRRLLSWRATNRQKKNHYGQVVPIEDIERIFEFVNSLVRINCICRYATLRSEQRYCYAVSMVPDGGQMGEMIRGSSLLNGPGSMGLETLTKEEALAAFRDHEKESLCHTVWTFVTPFIGGICNCDRAECGAMRSTVTHKLPMMFRAEYVADVDSDSCNGCRACMRACQFGAINYSAALRKAFIQPRDCYGCGVCRAHCTKDAIRLQDRRNLAATANLW